MMVLQTFSKTDLYPDWPTDLENNTDDLPWWNTELESIKAFGNENFKK